MLWSIYSVFVVDVASRVNELFLSATAFFIFQMLRWWAREVSWCCFIHTSGQFCFWHTLDLLDVTDVIDPDLCRRRTLQHAQRIKERMHRLRLQCSKEFQSEQQTAPQYTLASSLLYSMFQQWRRFSLLWILGFNSSLEAWLDIDPGSSVVGLHTLFWWQKDKCVCKI